MTMNAPMKKDPRVAGITVSLELIQPEVAAEWLTRNVNNRPVRKARVGFLTSEIKSDRWEVNGDAIRFGADGTLYDSQHRLMAIVAAGVPVWSVVVRGLSPSARNTIDLGGSSRNARDVVQMTDGVKVAAEHVGWVVAAEKMLRQGSLMGPTDRMTATGLREALARHGEALAALSASQSGDGRAADRVAVGPGKGDHLRDVAQDR